MHLTRDSKPKGIIGSFKKNVVRNMFEFCTSYYFGWRGMQSIIFLLSTLKITVNPKRDIIKRFKKGIENISECTLTWVYFWLLIIKLTDFLL